jgi:1A family penicillin-binding protein
MEHVRAYLIALGQDILQAANVIGKRLRLRNLGKIIFFGILALGVTIIAAAGIFYATTLALHGRDIENPTVLLNNKTTGITITDRNNVTLYQSSDSANRTIIAYEDIPEKMIYATLAAEDPDFFKHAGVSWRGMSRALYKNATAGATKEGGSTITQQLIKSTVLEPTRSLIRKGQEIILATELERRYSKQEIMGMYLNGIYYGGSAYGIDQAAQQYFGKPASQLTIGESALLAGLPLGPSRFDPIANRQAALERRNYILGKMRTNDYITDEQLAAAKAENPVTLPRNREIKAPHFVFYILSQLRTLYGDDLVDHGGLTVKTTLDSNKQDEAQRIVSEQVANLAGRSVSNGALISTNPETGDILAMVGSTDYYNPQFGTVNVTTSQRQPGSSFKPIVYLAALQKGWTDKTEVEDAPMSIPQSNGKPYVPQNYDLKFRGKVTLRRALANSLNIPAVKVMQFVGLPATLDQAYKLGITTLQQPERYGLSLVLGGGEVTMVDMAAVYGTFARGGIKSQPRAILQVKDRYDKDITIPNTPPTERVADANAVATLSSMLNDNATRSEIFGANSPMVTSQPTSVKTGTTNDFRDNWTAGYSKDTVTIVWVGNNDNSPMGNGVDGITGAAPIWNKYMEYTFRTK